VKGSLKKIPTLIHPPPPLSVVGVSNTKTSKNVEQGAETSNVPATLGTQIVCTTSTCYAYFIGTYKIEVEYDVVSGNIRMTNVGKVCMNRLKESFLQRFKENIHLPFLNIPMNLQKYVIHDMETEFGTGWSVKKKKHDSKLQELGIFFTTL
jgi:hypothetical protein